MIRDTCRHHDCEEIPTYHVEVIKKGAKKAMQWEANFCTAHLWEPTRIQIGGIDDHRMRLIIELYDWRRHNGSG